MTGWPKRQVWTKDGVAYRPKSFRDAMLDFKHLVRKAARPWRLRLAYAVAPELRKHSNVVGGTPIPHARCLEFTRVEMTNSYKQKWGWTREHGFRGPL